MRVPSRTVAGQGEDVDLQLSVGRCITLQQDEAHNRLDLRHGPRRRRRGEVSIRHRRDVGGAAALVCLLVEMRSRCLADGPPIIFDDGLPSSLLMNSIKLLFCCWASSRASPARPQVMPASLPPAPRDWAAQVGTSPVVQLLSSLQQCRRAPPTGVQLKRRIRRLLR